MALKVSPIQVMHSTAICISDCPVELPGNSELPIPSIPPESVVPGMHSEHQYCLKTPPGDFDGQSGEGPLI